MKEHYIADLIRLEENQLIESHYLVLSKQQRTTRTAKPYLSLILGDNSGQIEARVWDPTDTRIASDFLKGDVIKVRAAVSKFEGVLQLKIERLRTMAATEFSRADLLPATTYDVAELWQ
jgi:3'-5' exoribonuclease